MTSPSVSVVITCYNYARFVGAAIDSALAQTVAPKEIIVVDDGSTDASFEVISRYAGRVKIIRQPNEGQAAAGYRGFEVSSGGIIIFFDADDLLLPAAIEGVLRAWTENCAKVQFDLSIINTEGEDLRRRFCNFPPAYDARQAQKEFSLSGVCLSPVMSGNAYARKFLEQVLPLTSTKILDGVLNITAPLYGDIITIPRALGCYRLHGGNSDNQGAANPADPARFVKSISRRYEEIEALRAHAVRKGIGLPSGNLLDKDLVFINYRLMLKKMNVVYAHSGDDTVCGLLGFALKAINARSMPLGWKLGQSVWFILLTMMPKSAACLLVNLRFNRATFMQPLRRLFAG